MRIRNTSYNTFFMETLNLLLGLERSPCLFRNLDDSAVDFQDGGAMLLLQLPAEAQPADQKAGKRKGKLKKRKAESSIEEETDEGRNYFYQEVPLFLLPRTDLSNELASDGKLKNVSETHQTDLNLDRLRLLNRLFFSPCLTTFLDCLKVDLPI